MPIYLRPDAKPVVQFEAQFEVSPFLVFRRLRDGEGPLLVDARAEPTTSTLEGAIVPGEDWEPPADRDVLFFDDGGDEAIERARHWQGQGFLRVRALFGGLELWAFALDPEVVGTETFLRSLDPAP